MLITGFRPRSPQGGADFDYLTSAMSGFSGVIGWPDGESNVALTAVKSLVRVIPAAHPAVLSGRVTRTYSDDFYHRIHISPVAVALGNIFNGQSREISLWNSHLSARTLSGVSESGTDGLSFDLTLGLPTTFAALEERAYTLTASITGPAIVNASYLLQFQGEFPVLGVTGRRIVVWPFAPNWVSPVNETLEWKVQVLQAFDGSEQRRELRTKARRSFSYYMSISGTDTSRFENLLWGWQRRAFALPIWMDKRKATSGISEGAMSINLDTVNMSFTAGGLAIIMGNSREFEVVEVETVSVSSITLSRATTSAWSNGVSIYPCIIGHLPNAVTTRRHTDRTISATIDFACEPSVTDPYTPTATPLVIYDGFEVLTQQPNWLSPLDNTSECDFDTLDKETGAVQWYDSGSPLSVRRKYPWLLKSRVEIRAMREMLGRRRGRLKPLLVPSWHLDLRVIEGVGETSMSITVENNEFHEMVGVDVARNRIMMRLVDGSVFYRKVTGTAKVSGNTVIAVDESFGRAIATSEIKIVHLLMLNRLASDRVDLSWHTDSVVVMDTSFVTVKE